MTYDVEILEEYKTLRAEILMQIDHHRREYLILLPIMGTILTYAFTSKQPAFCLLAFSINLYSWRHHRTIWSTVIKLGAYIAVFIEPQIDGLQYERIMSKAGYKVKCKPFLPRLTAFLKIVPTYYTIIHLVSISSGLYLLRPYFVSYLLSTFGWDFSNNLILIFVVILILAFHLFSIDYLNEHGTIEEAEYWRDLLSEVKKEEAKPASDQA